MSAALARCVCRAGARAGDVQLRLSPAVSRGEGGAPQSSPGHAAVQPVTFSIPGSVSVLYKAPPPQYLIPRFFLISFVTSLSLVWANRCPRLGQLLLVFAKSPSDGAVHAACPPSWDK